MTIPASLQSILIIRLSAIGDIVMASPMIRLLRSRYPGAHLAWLVQPEGRDLLEANPLLDEVIVWPRNEWRRLLKERRWIRLASEIIRFRRRLLAQHFDLVIDAQGLLKSAVWAWSSGAPVRIGLGSKEGSAYFMKRVIEKPENDPRIGSEYRMLMQELGLDPGDFRMDVALSTADEMFVARWIGEQGLRDRGYVVFCPFTTRPQKHWVEGNWGMLAHRVWSEFGTRAVVMGGPGDSVSAARITCASHDPIIDMTGQTTLRQAAALISHAGLVVGVDTGLTHMGIAFNIPTIALFGSTCPYTDTGRDNTLILYKSLECSPCRRRPACGGAFGCMTSIGVDEVMAGIPRLVEGAPGWR